MARLGDLVVTIGAKTAAFDIALGKSMRKLKSFGQSTQRLGSQLSRNITMPLAALGGIAAKTAASFEFSMAKVQAVSGFAADEIKRLESQAKALGGSTSKSASEVAGLQLELAKLGKTSSEIEAMTESILSLSIAFDTDLGETAAVVGETLNQFGLSADQSGRIADNMATLFGSSALDLERFGSAMSVVGPTAAAMGLSVEETGAALGVLVNAGVDASTAGTSLTKALTTLAAKGMTGEQAMSSLFNGTLSVAEGFDIFGDRAGKIIPILQKGGESMAQLTEKQLEGAGAAKEARKVLEETAQGGFDKLKSSVEALGIEFGTALLPLVNKATEYLGELATRFSNLDNGTKKSIVNIALFAGAIGPVLYILPNIARGLKVARKAMLLFNKSVLANPYVLAAVAIAGIGFALYKVSQRTDAAGRSARRMNEAMKVAQTEAARETIKVQVLAKQYKRAGDNLGERKKIMDKIKEISPEYFGNLDSEKTNYEDLTTAIEAYNKAMIKKAMQAAMEDQLQDMASERVELLVEQNELLRKQQEQENRIARAKERVASGETSRAAAGETIGDAGKEIRLLQTYIDALDGQLAEHDAEMNHFIDAMTEQADVVGESTGAVDGNTNAVNANTDAVTGNGTAVGKTAEELEAEAEAAAAAAAARAELLQKLNAENDARKEQLEFMRELRSMQAEDITRESATGSDMGAYLEGLPDELSGLDFIPDAVDDFESDFTIDEVAFDKFQRIEQRAAMFRDMMRSTMEGLAPVATNFGNAMGHAFGQMAKGAQDGEEAMRNAARGMINQALAVAQASIIEAMISSQRFSGPAAPIIIPALVAGGIGLVQGLFNDIPAFAAGGIVSGPTLGLMGEYSGAASNPEVIAPLDKLQSMMGGQQVQVYGSIDGNSIRLANDRTNRNAKRFLR